MSLAERLLPGSCNQPWEVGALCKEFVIDVLEGFCICSCPEFKEMFIVMLQLEKIGNFCALPTITPNSSPMEMIEAICTKAVDNYDMIMDTGEVESPNSWYGTCLYGHNLVLEL